MSNWYFDKIAFFVGVAAIAIGAGVGQYFGF